MPKQSINVGATANDKKGDSLRAAFQKVNANFTELYTQLGLTDDDTLNLGAFEFAGSVISTTDSTAVVIDQAVTVTSDLTVGGDIVPSSNLGSTLGSSTNRFHSLFVGTGSVFIGDAKLSLEGGKLQSSVGFDLDGSVGVPTDISNLTDTTNLIPVDVADLTDTTNLLGGGSADTGTIDFVGNTISGTNEVLIGDALNFIRVREDDGENSPGVRLQNRIIDDVLSQYNLDTHFTLGELVNSNGDSRVQFTTTDTNLIADIENFGDQGQNQLTVTDGVDTFTFTEAESLGSSSGGGSFSFSFDVAPPESTRVLTQIRFNLFTILTNSVSLVNNDFSVSVTDDVSLTGSDSFRLRNRSGSEPVRIITDYNDGGDEHTWAFGANGDLTIPGDIIIPAGGSSTVAGRINNSVSDGGGLQIEADADFEIKVAQTFGAGTEGETTETAIWSFESDGSLILPSDTKIKEFAEIVRPPETTGHIAANTQGLTPGVTNNGIEYIATEILTQDWIVSRGYVQFADQSVYKISGINTNIYGELGGFLSLYESINKTSEQVWPIEIFANEQTIPKTLRVEVGSERWRLFANGDLGLPGGGRLGESSNNFTQLSGGIEDQVALVVVGEDRITLSSLIVDTESITLSTNVNAGVQKDWIFDTDGGLTLPAGGIIAEGTVDNLPTVEITPASYAGSVASQRLVIKTGQDSDYHLHLTNGDQTQTSLFLGTDTHHVKLGAGGSVGIKPRLNNAVYISTTDDAEVVDKYLWEFNSSGGITFPDASTQTTAFTTSPTLNVLKIDDGVHEQFQTKTGATGTVTHDCSLGHIIYHTSPAEYFAVNLTNLNLASGYATSITVVMVQGATGYGPNALQIGGVAQTINWQGGSLPAEPTANGVDVVTFSILNNSGTYTVLGQVTGFNEVP